MSAFWIIFTGSICFALIVMHWEDLEATERSAAIVAAAVWVALSPVLIAVHPETGKWRFCYPEFVPTFERKNQFDAKVGVWSQPKIEKWETTGRSSRAFFHLRLLLAFGFYKLLIFVFNDVVYERTRQRRLFARRKTSSLDGRLIK